MNLIPTVSNMVIRGSLVILCAAFVWGIGNFVTGFTAHKYLSSGSLFPAVDIALANTLGGLVFLIVAFYIRHTISEPSAVEDDNQNSPRLWLCYLNKQLLFSGALKGVNTSLFVFSATYVVATQALVLESTYIVWSLLLAIFFLTHKVPLIPSVLKALLLFLGVILVSGQTSLQLSSEYHLLGSAFGIAAGLSYAFFLFSWSRVTENLVDLKSQLLSTRLLLIISLVTIMLLTEILSVILLRMWWIPFTNLKYPDIVLQVVNGAFVMGLVYLLITIGMTYLKNAQEGASFIAALGLSFSIPFTLLPEFIVGKFIPTGLQFGGILLFMIGYVVMSVSLSDTQQKP